MTLRIEAAGITHRGSVADKTNEDCIAVGFWLSQEVMASARSFEHALDEPFTCVVADGMGGHHDGDRASLLVAKSLARRLTLSGVTKVDSEIRTVNAELFSLVAEMPELAGMGSTAVGLVAQGKRLAVFNVGDSRAYKLGSNGLMQLSVDDSMAPNWKPDSGLPRNTKLLQCFGGRTTFTDVSPHLHTEPCTPGSTYLLCCDGLYETLTEADMAGMIGPDLAESAEKLLRAALEKHARDNVTVALVRVAEEAR